LKISNAYLKELNIRYIEKKNNQTIDSLLMAIRECKENDVLVTLPSSKDQFTVDNISLNGYTEFFRYFYKNIFLPMVFKSPNSNVLLITDHIPLSSVPLTVTTDLILTKINIAIDGFIKYFYPIDEIYYAGINPHAGEGGLIGNEELGLHLPKNLNIKGPLPGDTLHFYQDLQKKQLFVYSYHDQALSKFKSENGVIGLNITFGLPFLRLSVDHGTAFNLYGKNTANISGMIYLLKEALRIKICQ
jgi:4-hydroxythreonine-4-phosphate dehydrogenase